MCAGHGLIIISGAVRQLSGLGWSSTRVPQITNYLDLHVWTCRIKAGDADPLYAYY